MELMSAPRRLHPALAKNEAGNACADGELVRSGAERKCTSEQRLFVPKGIDPASWCSCYASEYSRTFMENLKPESERSGRLWRPDERALVHCTRTVTTPRPAEVKTRIGPDLSGTWVLKVEDLELRLVSTEERQREDSADFDYQVGIVGFHGSIFYANATIVFFRNQERLDVRLQQTPFLPRGCNATKFSDGLISGVCVGSSSAPETVAFEMKRVNSAQGSTQSASPGGQAAGSPPKSEPIPQSGSVSEPTTVTPTPGSNSAASNCPEGIRLCQTNCAALSLRPTLDIVQRMSQCNRRCREQCPR
jgi:hypothetical protein